MERKESKKPSKCRRVFLIAIGIIAIALDKLEGKPAEPQPVTSGRIEIVG